MPVRTCAVLLALLPLIGAHAKPMAATDASCAGLLARLRSEIPVIGTPGRAVASAPTTCEFDNVHLQTDSRSGWDVGTVTVRGVPEGLATTEPIDLRIEAKNVLFALHSGQAVVDWMNRQQQIPFDLALEVTYDPAAKRLVLQELSWRNDTGWASVDGTVDGLGPEALSKLGDAPPLAAQLTAVHAHLDSKRFLLAYTLPFVSGLIAGGNTDPETFMRRRKAEVTGEIVSLFPDMSRDSLGAIIEFVRDYPHPVHPFDLSLQADGGGFGLQELGFEPGPPPLEKLKHLKVEATYGGAFH